MITDKVTGEKFKGISFKDYVFTHRHIGRHKDYLEIALWKGQNWYTNIAIECPSIKQSYISTCKYLWHLTRKRKEA